MELMHQLFNQMEKSKYKVILDKYFEYPNEIYKNLTKFKEKIKESKI